MPIFYILNCGNIFVIYRINNKCNKVAFEATLEKTYKTFQLIEMLDITKMNNHKSNNF